MTELELLSDSAEATEAYAEQFASCCHGESLTIFLKGELGAGKTTFCRGFLRGLGHEGNVKSPTYTVVEPYEINGMQLYHFDFYRVNSFEELEAIGIRDYFNDESICLVEWPERAADSSLVADMEIMLTYNDAEDSDNRQLEFSADSEQGAIILNACFEPCSTK